MAKPKPQATSVEIRESIGDTSDLKIFHNNILVGIWIRPEMTSGGIFLTAKTLDEDRWQGKVGLVLAKGPMAFVDEGNAQFHGQNVEVGDWVIFRTSDGFSMDVNGTHCRLLEDVHIKGVTAHPEIIN